MTPNIEWKPCMANDIDTILPYPGQIMMLDVLKSNLDHAETMWVDGKPIAAAGIQELVPAVCEAWALLSDEVLAKYPVALTRHAREWLDELQDKYGFVRVSAISPDTNRHLGWLYALGFEPEGLMHNCGPGGEGDFWMCGRIR